jgi:hypothetical protein
MRWTLSPASSLAVISDRYAAAVARGRIAVEPANTLAGFGAEPANTLAAFAGGGSPGPSGGGSDGTSEPGNTLAAFAARAAWYRLIVSRRTPVSASIRRKLQPRSNNARTCCRFAICR